MMARGMHPEHHRTKVHRIPALLSALIVCCATASTSAIADNEPRRQEIDVLHYRFEITLDPVDSHIEGRAAVRVRFTRDDVASFSLDLVGPTPADRDQPRGMTVDAVSRDDVIDDVHAPIPIEFVHRDDILHITSDLPLPATGDVREYVITYHGVPNDGLIIGETQDGGRTFFSDNFPNRARHYLPAVDHPSDKATCEFVVTAPNDLQVVANGRQIEETNLESGLRLTHWREGVPIATYLMVFGAAEFAVQTVDDFECIPIQTWVYAPQRDEGFDDFLITPDALRFFVDHVGPFPYEKLANVQSKTRYGGMENASCIFYNERLIGGRRSFDGTIVHEIAHQWFGNSVTESDWNHIWLSEGFATYFTHLYNESAFGVERMNEGLRRDRDRVIRYENRHPEIAVVDEDVPIDDILSTLSYQKGSWVLHMLRRQIGDNAFWKGVRDYYAQHRDSNALSDDLRTAMENASTQDLKWFFDQWVYSSGHPVLEVDWSSGEANATIRLTIRQVQEDDRAFRFPLDVELLDSEGKRLAIKRVDIANRRESFEFDAGGKIAEVKLDPRTNLLFERAGDSGDE